MEMVDLVVVDVDSTVVDNWEAVLFGAVVGSVVVSLDVGDEVAGLGVGFSVEVEFRVVGMKVDSGVGLGSSVVSLRVVDLMVVDLTKVGFKVADSSVVDSEVVVSINLKVVCSGEAVSESMIVVGDFAISVVVWGVGVLLRLADGFADVLVSTSPADELDARPLRPPPLFSPSAPCSTPTPPSKPPSVVAFPWVSSPSVVRGLSTCLSITLMPQGSVCPRAGVADSPSCETNPS